MSVMINSQEGKGDVAVDLGLDGDLHLEVEVKTELQSFLGSDGALGGAGGNRGGFWGRHVLLILSRALWVGFYMKIDRPEV